MSFLKYENDILKFEDISIREIAEGRATHSTVIANKLSQIILESFQIHLLHLMQRCVFLSNQIQI